MTAFGRQTARTLDDKNQAVRRQKPQSVENCNTPSHTAKGWLNCEVLIAANNYKIDALFPRLFAA